MLWSKRSDSGGRRWRRQAGAPAEGLIRASCCDFRCIVLLLRSRAAPKDGNIAPWAGRNARGVGHGAKPQAAVAAVPKWIAPLSIKQ